MIGEIPAGWSIKTVADICDKPQYGLTASANSSSDVGPKFLRITDITQSGVNWDKVPYCECQIDQIDKFRLFNNDILFARIGGTTGKSFIVKNPPQSVFASYLIRLRVLSEKDNPNYLFFYFQSPFYWQQINANKDNNLKGGVNASVLSKLQIISPPLKEQQKIAAVLFKIQQAIEVQESIIEAAQELKKSTMQHVFTYGLRGEKTKETEIGWMPEGWEIKRLGEFANVVTKGSSPTWQGFEYCEDGILFIRSQNVGNGMLLLNDLVHLPTSFNLKEKRSIIHAGDLLINLVGASIGRAAIADERINGSNTNQAVAIVRLNEGQLTNWYTMYFLLTDKGQEVINFNKKDIARANISLTDIKNFLIPVPTINEQKNISDILQKIDKKIELHTSKRTTLQDLFKTMLNKLMTGEIRVNNLDVNVSEVVKERL